MLLTFSSGSAGGTGVSGLSASADLSFFLSPFLSFPFPVPGSPDLGRRGTNGILGNKRDVQNYKYDSHNETDKKMDYKF